MFAGPQVQNWGAQLQAGNEHNYVRHPVAAGSMDASTFVSERFDYFLASGRNPAASCKVSQMVATGDYPQQHWMVMRVESSVLNNDNKARINELVTKYENAGLNAGQINTLFFGDAQASGAIKQQLSQDIQEQVQADKVELETCLKHLYGTNDAKTL